MPWPRWSPSTPIVSSGVASSTKPYRRFEVFGERQSAHRCDRSKSCRVRDDDLTLPLQSRPRAVLPAPHSGRCGPVKRRSRARPRRHGYGLAGEHEPLLHLVVVQGVATRHRHLALDQPRPAGAADAALARVRGVGPNGERGVEHGALGRHPERRRPPVEPHRHLCGVRLRRRRCRRRAPDRQGLTLDVEQLEVDVPARDAAGRAARCGPARPSRRGRTAAIRRRRRAARGWPAAGRAWPRRSGR